MIFKIKKKWWLVLRVRSKNDGCCYPEHRIILLHEKLKGKALREIAIHETLHAVNWSKSEKQVKLAASAIINILEVL